MKQAFIADLHIHTILSDGKQNPQQVSSMSKQKGIIAGVSDHISSYHQINSKNSFNQYVDAIKAEGLLVGGEICLGDNLKISEQDLDSLDYIIGSMHMIEFEPGLKLYFWDQRARFPDHKKFIEIYVNKIIHFLNNTKMDILGHPTAMPFFLSEYNKEELINMDQAIRIVEAAVKNNVAIEISTRWGVPNKNILFQAVLQNCKVSLGSDAHDASLCLEIGSGLHIMQEVGLSTDKLFNPLL